ncbi:hypothetical protein BUZ24_04170 [Staphylococcus haemolyticus]|nr:hypothetical protein BUZ24_04170 [Staphylococcus haemolyticus]
MLQAKQVGVRGPSKENFIKKFYKQCKLGFGAPAKRISLRNSTSNASWGYNEINFEKILFLSHSLVLF